MAKLKKAPGRIIGRWKAEAIASNRGASDEDLARIVNEAASKQGYDYTITPDKVRTRTKKKRRRRAGTTASASNTAPAPAPNSTPAASITLEDIRSVKGLADRIGADKVKELARMLSR